MCSELSIRPVGRPLAGSVRWLVACFVGNGFFAVAKVFSMAPCWVPSTARNEGAVRRFGSSRGFHQWRVLPTLVDDPIEIDDGVSHHSADIAGIAAPGVNVRGFALGFCAFFQVESFALAQSGWAVSTVWLSPTTALSRVRLFGEQPRPPFATLLLHLHLLPGVLTAGHCDKDRLLPLVLAWSIEG